MMELDATLHVSEAAMLAVADGRGSITVISNTNIHPCCQCYVLVSIAVVVSSLDLWYG